MAYPSTDMHIRRRLKRESWGDQYMLVMLRRPNASILHLSTCPQRPPQIRSLSLLSPLLQKWRPSPTPRNIPSTKVNVTDSRDTNTSLDNRNQVIHQEQNPYQEPVSEAFNGEQREHEHRHYTPEEDLQRRRYAAGMMVAFGITGVNAYVWFQWNLAKSSASRGDSKRLQTMMDHFLVSRKNWEQGRWWTTITAGFSHIQTWHLLANSLGLLSFLPAVGSMIGVIPVTISYLICIAGGSFFTLYEKETFTEPKAVEAAEPFAGSFSTALQWLERQVQTQPQQPSKPLDTPGLGASAGVFGLFTLSVLIAPTSSVALFFIPLPAWLAWGLLTGVDGYCYLSEEGRQKMISLTGTQMGHEAHLGGIGSALLLGFFALRGRIWPR